MTSEATALYKGYRDTVSRMGETKMAKYQRNKELRAEIKRLESLKDDVDGAEWDRLHWLIAQLCDEIEA